MAPVDHNRYVTTLQAWSKYASLWTITVGGIVLLGWLLDITLLKTILPGTTTTKANTAIALVLLGLALWLLHAPAGQPRQAVIRRGCAALAGLLGVLTLSEYMFSWNLGIDELLFRDNSLTGDFPGRMSPVTAFNLLMLGMAILLVDIYGLHRTSQALALAASFAGLLSFLGYLYGEASLYQLANFTAIALPTAVTFSVAGLAFLFATANRGWMVILTSGSAGGRLARRLLPATVLLPIVIGWLRLRGQQAGWYGTGLGLAIFAVANIVLFTALIARGAASLIESDVARRQAEDQILGLNAELEGRVLERTAALARESSLMQALMDNIPDTIYFKDRHSRFTRINQAQARVLGVAEPELALGKTDADFQAPHLAAAFADEEKQILETGQSVIERVEYNPAADGQPRWFSSNKVPMRDPEGRVIGLVGISHNITERMQSAEAVREANAQLTERIRQMAVLNELAEQLQACLALGEVYQVTTRLVGQLFPTESGALYITNNSRNLIETAATWGSPPLEAQVLGLDDCWALRRGRTHLSGPLRSSALPCQHLLESQPALSVCIPLLAQGETLGIWHLRAGIEAAGRFDDAVLQLARVVADSVALAMANLNLREKLRQQSIRDPLTELFNRRYMEESLARELLRAARSRQPVGVIMLDVDHFKAINDRYGHDTGDAVLRDLGRFLKDNIRGGDIACRYGGEEFTLVLPESNLEQTLERAERHLMRFKSRALRHGEVDLEPVTLSIGVASYPQNGQTSEQLLRAADSALYRAKHAGRDQVQAAA